MNYKLAHGKLGQILNILRKAKKNSPENEMPRKMEDDEDMSARIICQNCSKII